MTTSESSEQQIISQLYIDGATELPPEALDFTIMQQARDAIGPSNHTLRSSNSTRKWHWQLSIAASVMIVSLVFINNVDDFAPMNEKTEVLNFIPEMSAPNDILEQRGDNVGLHSRPEMAEGAEVLTNSPNTLLLKKERRAEKRMNLPTLSKPVVQESKVQSLIADESFRIETFSGTPIATEKEQRVVAGNRPDSDSHETLDLDYLNGLADEMLHIRSLLEANDDKEQWTDLNKQLAQIQEQIYDEVYVHKVRYPDAIIPETYLNLLSKQQLVELHLIDKDEIKSEIKP